jgi:two-component system phosphate regulon sensor histidine kinase PhoR
MKEGSTDLQLVNNLADILNGAEGLNTELLKLALNSSIVSILITDNRLPDNPIIYCNKAFEHVTGYSREEVIGQNCRFLQGQERDDVGALTIRQGLIEGSDVEVVIKNFKKDGCAFYNELHISPVRDSLGTITHFIGIQLDVTERENIELSSPAHIEQDKWFNSFLRAIRSLLPKF